MASAFSKHEASSVSDFSILFDVLSGIQEHRVILGLTTLSRIALRGGRYI